MNAPDEKAESPLRRNLRGLNVWLILWAATFVIVLAISAFIGEFPRHLGDIAGGLIASLVIASVFLGLWLFVRWIRYWRNLRWVLFGAACIATLIGIFYAEEDWRGKHGWKDYKDEWQAKGESFDLAAFIPPAVPPDQNFALTPVVASSYNFILDSDGKVIPYKQRDTNHVNLLRMSIYSDHGSNRPQPGNWLRATPANLKAFQEYYRTPRTMTSRSGMEITTNEFPVSQQPQSPAVDVLTALSKYDSTLEQLRTAAKLPYSRFPLNYDAEPPATILLPHLAGLKGCSEVLGLRATAELEAGKGSAAESDIHLLLRLAASIDSEPFLITHLVRIAMVQRAINPIWQGLVEHKWSDVELAAIDKDLSDLNFLKEYDFSMRGDCAFGIANVNYVRRTRDANLMEASSKTSSPPILYAIPSGWFYQNNVTVARTYRDELLPRVNLQTRTVSPESESNTNMLPPELESPTPYNFVARLLLPALNKAVQRFAHAQASVDLARVAIALERYRLANGNYPETLNSLSPQFMHQVPHDIMNGQPLQYRRTDGDEFVLYSVGWNQTDDGGKIGLEKGTTLQQKITKGDWVWRFPDR